MRKNCHILPVIFNANQWLKIEYSDTLLANSSTGGIATVLNYTLSGAAGSLTVEVAATSSVVLPNTGVPWILGDVNNTITANAPTQATIRAFYT